MPLVACHDCDLLQQECAVPAGGKARCARCGAVLYRAAPDALDRTLALAITALIAYGVANLFPIVIISAVGRRTSATLFESVVAMWHQDMRGVALLVFITAILLPAVAILTMIYVVLQARGGNPPDHLGSFLRLLRWIKPWAMVEVLMLGVLVSVVKLGAYARVTPAPALWAIAALVVIMAAISTIFDPREIWAGIHSSEFRSPDSPPGLLPPTLSDSRAPKETIEARKEMQP